MDRPPYFLQAQGICSTDIWEELVLFFCIMLLFYNTTLLWGLPLYFIFWHSVPAIASQLSLSNKKFTIKNLFTYSKLGYVNWLVAFLLLLAGFLVYYLLQPAFFVWLIGLVFALTTPHVVVMHIVYVQNILLFDKRLK